MIFTSTLLFSSLAAGVVASSGHVIDLKLSELYAYNPKHQKQIFDVDFVIEAEFGSPPNKFNLVIDTGSPDTWVQGTNLSEGPIFEPDQSSTFINKTIPWRFEYGGPKKVFISFAAGYAAKDTITIGSGKPKLTLQNETFAVAEESARTPVPRTQGFLGMAYDSHVSSYNAPVFVQQAINRGLLRENRFGIRLHRAQDANPTPPPTPGEVGIRLRKDAGNVTLGGIDESQFTGDITYVPVQQHKGFWQTKIDGIYVNDQLIEGTENYNSIADTGTSILVLPPKLAQAFHQPLNGRIVKPTPPSSPKGVYFVPCNTTIDVKIKIGGTFFPVKAQDLFNGYGNKAHTKCFTNTIGVIAENASKNGTYPSNASPVMVLGLPLLLSTYTIFDYDQGGRLGFATLKDNGDLPTVARIDVTQYAEQFSKYADIEEGDEIQFEPMKSYRR